MGRCILGYFFLWILSAFPFKLYHENFSYNFSGTCITTYTNFTWILRLMTLRLDPTTIRQSFASDQNWKRMCWLANFADFHPKPELITMSTFPHVSKKKYYFRFRIWEFMGNSIVEAFDSYVSTTFIFHLQTKLETDMLTCEFWGFS